MLCTFCLRIRSSTEVSSIVITLVFGRALGFVALAIWRTRTRSARKVRIYGFSLY